HTGTRSQLPAAALRLLYRSHPGRLRIHVPPGRTGVLGIHERARGSRIIGSLSAAEYRGAPGHVYTGPFPSFVLEIRTDGAAPAADDRQHRAAGASDGHHRGKD